MCKKSLLMMLLLALLVPWAANAQTSLWSEDFEDGDMPAGWTTDGPGSWSVGVGDYSTSTGAGHGSYNAKITHGTTGNVTKLITPEIDLSSVTSAELSFMHVQRSWAGDIDQLRVYYRTSSSGSWNQLVAYTTAFASWTTESGIVLPNPSSTYQLAFEHTDKYGYGVGVDNIVIVQGASCPKPAGLAVTPNGQSATLTWAGDAATFSVAHSLDASAAPADNIVATVSTTTYTMDNLALDEDHYFWVRANCSGTEQSEWSDPVSVHVGYCVPAPSSVDNSGITNVTFGIEDYIVNNSTHPSAAPYYGDYTAQIGAVQAGVEATVAITYATSYTYNTYVWVDLDNSLSFDSDEVVCYGESSSTSPTTLTLHFTIPVNQTLGDYRMRIGGADSGLGSNPANANPCYSSSYGIFEDYTLRVLAGPTCWQPSAPEFARITITSADVAWTPTGTETQWQLCINGDEDNLILVDEPAYSMTNLTPDTEYTVKVRAYCSADDQSTWSASNSFSTLVACETPTNLAFADITAYSANVAWTSDNTNIEMRYSVDVRPITTFDDSQMHGWTNIDADGDGYIWVLATEAAGVYHNTGVDLTGQGHNGSNDFIVSGSYTNAAGTALTPDNYLVSPQITLGGSISFWAQAQDVSYAAEHFGVAVSTTGNTDAADFTTIQEWTMTAKSAGTLRSNNAKRGGNNLRAGNWYQYTVDLSAYSGQGYVAIRHFDCTDQFILNVDDIFIEQPGFELPWVYVTNPASPQALTNLEPETTYLVQVRAYCEESGYNSSWLEGTFTTLPACMVPTNLVVSNIDKRSADLAWVSNGDEEAWQICVNGDEENLIYVTDTAYTLTDLLPDQTRYIVKVRAYCDEQLQSAWSSPVTFYTLIACPAPTDLVISDIANVSAVVSWVSDGDIELQYAEDVWMHYDNGVYATTMGAGGTIYWGMMLPAESLTAGEPLTKVALHTSYAGEATLNVYLGGDQPTGTPAATQTFTMLGDGDFMEIVLDTPVDIDGTENLWITFYQSGLTYPADGCAGPTDPNGRWVSLDGEEWADIAGYGYDYTWMIRAAFGNASTEWVTVDNAASPQTIAGLTPETNYFVRVKHICGGIDGESVWTSTMFTTDIACPAPEALGATPYALSAELSWEGASESYTVRYGYDEIDETLYSEDFAEGIPADWTNDATYPWTVEDGYIKSGNAAVSSSTSTISFTMNVSADAYFEFDAKCMGEGTSSIWDKCMFTLDGTTMFTKGANGDHWDHYSYPITAGEHTFTWSYQKDSSVNPTGDYMAVDNIAIVTSHIVWTTVTAETNEYLLTGLTPLTTYHVQVMGDCGDFGTSEWSEMISFTTTEDACPMPTNLAVNAETLTATTADLSWNSTPDVESFTVRYRAPQHAAEGSLYEAFGTSIPTGWTLYTGLLDTVMVRPSALTSATYGWNFGTGNGVFDNHARCNIYSNYQRWLVTPEVTVAAGASLAFDLALTVYTSGSNASPTPGNQADDKFIVLISTDSLQTWNILRQWDNQGSEYVYDEITNNTNGQPVSIDLSAYAGQTVHIAFYGESTVSGGDNNLHIDNVIIGEVIPATDWQTVTTTDMNVTLTGLTPETPYEAQVKSDCSDPEAWSNTATFTTLEQTIVTQTIELAAGTNWFSTYLEITLDDLKAALAAATPSKAITIKSSDGKTAVYSPRTHTWSGQLTSMDVVMRYNIIMAEASEITLEGMPIDPAEHTITILGGGAKTWIGFPYSESMTPGTVFAGFAVNGDKIKSGSGANSTFSRNQWSGQVTTLEPGQGYLYTSPANAADRVFVFPSLSK